MTRRGFFSLATPELIRRESEPEPIYPSGIAITAHNEHQRERLEAFALTLGLPVERSANSTTLRIPDGHSVPTNWERSYDTRQYVTLTLRNPI